MIDTICVGCELPVPVNDLGLCEECAAKLEWDLIRARDWDYAISAFGVEPAQREALRERIIQAYGTAYELIIPSGASPKTPRKNKRSRSRARQRQRVIVSHAQRDYSTEDVLQAARDFLQGQGDDWISFSRLSQYLYERFANLNPKRLGESGRNYKSLLKFVLDYPSALTVCKDDRGVYWVRLQ